MAKVLRVLKENDTSIVPELYLLVQEVASSEFSSVNWHKKDSPLRKQARTLNNIKEKDEEKMCFFGLWMKFELPFQRNKIDIMMNKLDFE